MPASHWPLRPTTAPTAERIPDPPIQRWHYEMMTEIPNVRQIRGEDRRRWFFDNYFDLIVWYRAEGISGFQLCYDRDGAPRAWTWTEDSGCSHHGIDDGDDPLLVYKATPILVADGAFDAVSVKRRFVVAAASIAAEIRHLVLMQLDQEEQRNANNTSEDIRRPADGPSKSSS